jgi:colicin import membrane protein
MSVKTNAVLVCTSLYFFPPARVVLLRRTAPKTLKYRLKWIRYFAIIKRVPILHQANASRYLARIQAAIFANIDQPASWQGQKCSVRFMLQRDGTVQDPTVESGDRPFCAQVMSALKKPTSRPRRTKKPIKLQSCRAGREALSLPAEMAPAITRAISNKIS